MVVARGREMGNVELMFNRYRVLQDEKRFGDWLHITKLYI